VFAWRSGRTILADAYAEPPFRVGPAFSEGPDVHMILASSAPGIFGGDDFEQHIRVERGARVRLTSQSALQVHPAAGGGARLHSTYEVEEGAALHCQWDPLIPFAEAHLVQQTEIRLADDASLYWSDGFMSGREGRGERWRFAALAHELRILRAGRLEYLERYRLTSAEDAPARPWIAGDACYFGTVVAAGKRADPVACARLQSDLAALNDLRAGVDALDERLLLVRLTAGAGVPFHEARALIRSAVFALDRSDDAP
jgi:urease accessory protein